MQQKKRTVRLMGTVIDLQIEHENPDEILNEAVEMLEKYEKRFSANDPASELGEVNKNAGIHPVSVHPDLYELIKIGKFHSCAEGSNLNITIGPLVQLWRIGFSDAKVPSPEEIQAMLAIINPADIILEDENHSVFLKKTGMAIDLGALAKGYIADKIITYFKEKEVLSALISLGGNIVTLGPAPARLNHFWRIGIQNPVLARGSYQAVLKVKDQSVVTSGIYERSLTKEGKTYHHILDSHTGYPIETEAASLTIVSRLSVDGEIWTTRLFGKPVNEILSILNEEEDIEGLVIDRTGETFSSNGLKSSIDYLKGKV